MTKELLKDEIDKVLDEHLPALYRVILAFEIPDLEVHEIEEETPEWSDFVAKTYGCLADAPIERGDQGWFEKREIIQ